MNAKKILWPALAASLALTGACSKSKVDDATPMVAADTIYVGGDIVTINDAQPTAEALAVKDGKILAVGRACRRRSQPTRATRRKSWTSPARRCCPAFSTRTATTSARCR